MNFKEIDKDTDKRILIILVVIIFVASMVYFEMKKDINSINETTIRATMAMYWTSYGTVLQAVFAAFQAVFAGIIIIMTLALGKKQAKLAIQQNEIVKEQNEMTRRQINLNLYDKRYRIYRTLEDTLEKEFLSMQFPNELQQNDQQYIETYCGKLFTLKVLVRDRVFLLDADTNGVIDSVFKDVENIIKNIATIYFYNAYKGIRGEREAIRYNEAKSERDKIIKLINEIHKQFVSILDFQKI